MDVKGWADEFYQLLDEEKMTEKQKKIVQASIEVFAEKGYAGSSTSEIAKKAGVAEGPFSGIIRRRRICCSPS